MMQLEGEFLHVLREVLTPACLFWFSEMGVSCNPSRARTHCVAEDDLELLILQAAPL